MRGIVCGKVCWDVYVKSVRGLLDVCWICVDSLLMHLVYTSVCACVHGGTMVAGLCLSGIEHAVQPATVSLLLNNRTPDGTSFEGCSCKEDASHGQSDAWMDGCIQGGWDEWESDSMKNHKSRMCLEMHLTAGARRPRPCWNGPPPSAPGPAGLPE